MNKSESIVSGMRATGRLHIGNYLGALKQWVELQNKGDMQYYFFMADLHALTTDFEPKELRANTLEAVAEYIAAGIDPKKSVLFIQNHVPEHAELAWIFSCGIPIGELERMTQFKDKSRQNKNNINAGLLTYPTLMAADILLYKPSFVPVGDDQTQHLELTRMIARKFNNKFGRTFPEPKNFLIKPLRIMSLTHPDQKMSKTNDEALMLDDTPEEITRKLKKAVTATEGNSKSPGAENLLFLLRHFGTKDQITRFEDASKDGSIKFSELKQVLAQDIIEHFAEFRQKKRALLSDTDVLTDILADGARRAKAVAHETLMEVKEKVGLL
jgi:tryptophanyl-tRNA synthetase